MDYSVNVFLDRLYNCLQSAKTLVNCELSEMDTLMAAKRKLLKELLGIEKLERIFPNYEPVFTPEETAAADGYTVSRYTTEAYPGLFAPFYVLRPERSVRNRAVVYCHGHGKGVAETLDESLGESYHNYLPIRLAQAGYTVYAPGFAGFESVFKGYKQDDLNGCFAVGTNLLLHGLTVTGVRVGQAMQAIRLANLEFEKVSLFGMSGGGMVAGYTAALDGITDNVCVSGYANMFKKSIMPMRHCVDNYIPNIFSVGEFAEVVSLAAGKRLLVLSGESDSGFPADGAQQAFEYIRAVYERLGLSEKAELNIFEGGHVINVDAYIKWVGREDYENYG